MPDRPRIRGRRPLPLDQLTSLVQALPQPIFVCDETDHVIEANAAACQVFGLGRGEFEGTNVSTLLPKVTDDLQMERAASRDRTRASRADGSTFPAEVRRARLETPAGAVDVYIVDDVIEQALAEQALRLSEQRLQTVASNAPVGLLAFDRDGVFTLCEGKLMESFRRKPEELIGLAATNVFRTRPEIVNMVRAALDGTEVTGCVTIARKRLEVTLTPVRDASGDVGNVIVLALDVTERIEAEQALLSALDFQHLVMESTADAIVAFDVEGRVTLTNRRAFEMTGYSQEELIGQSYRVIIAPDRVHAMEAALRETVQQGLRMEGFETEAVRKDGRRVQIALNLAPLLERGEIVGGVGTAEDITARKLTERQLASQRQLLELIAVGEPLETVLDMLVSTIEDQAPGAMCSVLILEHGRLYTASAPSLPDAYNTAVDGAEVGPSAGSCGTAAFRRETVVVSDIATHPLWDGIRDAALAHGLRSCWSTPIFSGADLLGTFAIYYREPRSPNKSDRRLIRIATHVAGIAIERHRTAAAASGRTEELERLYTQLVSANAELAESKVRLEEKSALLERTLEHERERARRDQLTGTLNHAAITEELRELIANPNLGSVAVAMVDVDGLKAANDTYGHPIGDAVLVLVAQILAERGAVVGRYGGDEFVAILPGASRAQAESYRDATLTALLNARVNDPQTGTLIPVVASIGLAVFPQEAETVDDLIRLADGAMYASRRNRPQGDGRAALRSLGSDRAARMVGEIVPLLTSPGDLGDKLRLVSHRLSVGAGYDGVTFVLIDHERSHVGTSAFSYALDADRERSSGAGRPALNDVLAQALRTQRRPLIIDDVEHDARLRDDELAALRLAGIRTALVAPMLWQDELIGALSVGSKLPGAFSARDAEFVAAVATQVTAIVRMASMLDEVRASSERLMRAHTETVLMLAGAAEAHDQSTGRHLQRVRGLTESIALELGKTEDEARELGLAAILHDIGKIRVPDIVLGSSAKLAESEWVLMKQHTLWGSDFLAGQQGFHLAAEVARSHHERWDGTGYPDGLSGDAIPESAQITAVADAFDAMTNDRPYRVGRPAADAVRELLTCSGSQFSPRVVDAVLRLFERNELRFAETEDEADEARAA
jgi:diguanylate cyclase (GGDEF)-like protein/PAS domain S-box-containing protein